MVQIGRPTDYTQELADQICSELAEGKSLRSVCATMGMPDKSTVFRWLRTRKDFSDQYAKAKEESTDAMAEEVLDIADDGRNDFVLTLKGVQFDKEAVLRSRLRVDTRKWLMSKMKPKKYGDKLDMTTNGKDLPATVVAYEKMTDEELEYELNQRRKNSLAEAVRREGATPQE